MNTASFFKNGTQSLPIIRFRAVLIAVTLTVLLSLISVQAAGQLPSGSGWHVLANTQMSSMCVGNVSNGMYSDKTMTTTTNYDFNCNEIIPWSGGAIDDAHQRLIVWGGGHSDYAGDEVFVLNLSGTPSWQLFTNPTIPVPYEWDGNNWEGLNPYYVRLVDGGTYQPGATPASRHTYNGLQYVPYQNKLYSFGGSLANGGFLSQEIWTLDMGSKTWTMVGPPFSQSPGFPTTAYNANNGHIVMHDKNWALFDYDPHTNTWTTLTESYHVDDGTTAAIDPVNNLLVFVGSAGTTNNTTYPSVPTSHTVQVFSLCTLQHAGMEPGWLRFDLSQCRPSMGFCSRTHGRLPRRRQPSLFLEHGTGYGSNTVWVRTVSPVPRCSYQSEPFSGKGRRLSARSGGHITG